MNGARSVVAIVTFLLLSGLVQTVCAGKSQISLDRNTYPSARAERAIAAWNGEEELLLMSSEVRTGFQGRMLEMLALPSQPSDVRECDVGSFRTMVESFDAKAARLNARGGPGNENWTNDPIDSEPYVPLNVVFDNVSAARNITVVRIDTKEAFDIYIRTYASSLGISNYSHGLSNIADSYIRRGFVYFSFDVVELSTENRTVSPVMYRFNSTSLFYPQDLTAWSLSGFQQKIYCVDLFLLMTGTLKEKDFGYGGLFSGAGTNNGDIIFYSTDELGAVIPELAGLFPDGAIASHLWTRNRYHVNAMKNLNLTEADVDITTAKRLDEQRSLIAWRDAIAPLKPSIAFILGWHLYQPGVKYPSAGSGVLILAGMVCFILLTCYFFNHILKWTRLKESRPKRIAVSLAVGMAVLLPVSFIPDVAVAQILGGFCLPLQIYVGYILWIFLLAVKIARGGPEIPKPGHLSDGKDQTKS